MNTQAETNPITKVAEEAHEIEYSLQERVCGQVAESVEVAAEAILTARRFEACAEQGRSIREEAGLGFVP